MKLIFHILIRVLFFLLLTVLTQVGGLAYLCYLWVQKMIKSMRWKGRFARLGTGLIIYLFISLLITPPLAKQFGRVPLPWISREQFSVQPATWLICLMNRHYVKPQLKTVFKEVAQSYQQNHPTSTLIYLDANFPFFDGFPLLPHRSHDDGEKLDLTFRYTDENNREQNNAPSLLGYGYCEKPKSGEINTPKECSQKGYWQYSLLSTFVRQSRKSHQFDHQATRELLQLFIDQPRVRKIFIEPHLKQRLRLNSVAKIRFHGCAAVRHDDHIHVQL